MESCWRLDNKLQIKNAVINKNTFCHGYPLNKDCETRLLASKTRILDCMTTIPTASCNFILSQFTGQAVLLLVQKPSSNFVAAYDHGSQACITTSVTLSYIVWSLISLASNYAVWGPAHCFTYQPTQSDLDAH